MTNYDVSRSAMETASEKANRSFTDYHGYRLWVEYAGLRKWKIRIVGPAVNGAGGQFPPGNTIRIEVAGPLDHSSENAARDFAVEWARRDFLSYLKPVDEPVWRSE